MSSPAARFLACLLGPLLAAVLYAPNWEGTFLEDDLFLPNLIGAEAEGGGLDWGKVLSEFGRPWGADRGMFYRPIVTLSAAVDYALSSAPARMLHVTNVLIHVLAAFFCGLLCMRVCPKRAVLAGLLGGMLFALHPAATEPVCWIAGRTSSLALVFQLAALVAFARYRRERSHISLWLCGLACALAYLSKEEAIVTPAVLLLWDGILCVVHGGRLRWKAHIALAPVWLAYWAARWFALGEHWAGGEQPALSVPLAAQHLIEKLAVVLAPFMQQRWPGQEALLAACALAVLLACLTHRVSRWVLALCALWGAVSVAPSLPYPQSLDLAGSRYVYAAVAALSLAAVVALDSRFAWIRRGLPVVLVVWCMLFASVTAQRTQDYVLAYENVHRLEASLAKATQDSTAERPLAVMATPPGVRGVPSIRASSLFALGERPFVAEDVPVLSLWFLFYRTPRSMNLWKAAGPLRAMQRMGADVVGWSNTLGEFEPLTRSRPPFQARELSSLDGRRFDFGGDSVSPARIESLRVEVSKPGTGAGAGKLASHSGKLWWFVRPAGSDTDVLSKPRVFRGPWADGDQKVFSIDLFDDWEFLSASYTGGIHGFIVELDGQADSVVRVSTAPRLETLPLPTVFADRNLTIREEATVLRAPELPRDGLSMQLVLLGPDRGYATTVQPGQPIHFPDEIVHPAERLAQFSRISRYYYYFVARSPAGRSLPGARSEMDWLRLKKAKASP